MSLPYGLYSIAMLQSVSPFLMDTDATLNFSFALPILANVKEPMTKVKTKIKIPTEFSEIYEEYNEKQIKAGFNLKDYKGRQATLYSYPLEDFGEGVYISLIVCDGRIIGGDVSSVSANGFVLPLQDCKSNLKYCEKTGD